MCPASLDLRQRVGGVWGCVDQNVIVTSPGPYPTPKPVCAPAPQGTYNVDPGSEYRYCVPTSTSEGPGRLPWAAFVARPEAQYGALTKDGYITLW